VGDFRSGSVREERSALVVSGCQWHECWERGAGGAGGRRVGQPADFALLVPLDNFWGKNDLAAVSDLYAANNPIAGRPDGVADAELAVDPYFPKTIPSIPADIRGKAVHFGGRNRLFLDGHVKFLKDARTD
jgi:prepilin-type processing-associated H-X9-DG protein